MRARWVTVLLAVVAWTLASLASAQSATSQPTFYPKRQQIIFTPTEVKGDMDRPGGSVVIVPGKRKHPSMIQLRTNFRDKLVSSVHGL
ncbi:MAG: hypothetical protein ABIJ09_19455 [Pseudomonadota bacterium]